MANTANTHKLKTNVLRYGQSNKALSTNIKSNVPALTSAATLNTGHKLAIILENFSNALCRSLSSELRVHWHYRGF